MFKRVFFFVLIFLAFSTHATILDQVVRAWDRKNPQNGSLRRAMSLAGIAGVLSLNLAATFLVSMELHRKFRNPAGAITQ